MNQRVLGSRQHVEAERALSWLKENGSTAYVEAIDEGVGNWLSSVGASAASGALSGLAGGPLGVIGGAVLGALGAAAAPGSPQKPPISPAVPASPPSAPAAASTPMSASAPASTPAPSSSAAPVVAGATGEPTAPGSTVSPQSLQQLAQQLLPILTKLLSQQSQQAPAGSSRESLEADVWSREGGDFVPDEAFLRVAQSAGQQEDVVVRDHRTGAPTSYVTPVVRDHRTAPPTSNASPASSFSWNASTASWQRPPANPTPAYTPPVSWQPPVSYPTPAYPPPAPTFPAPFPGSAYGEPSTPWPGANSPWAGGYPSPGVYSPWPGGYPQYQPPFVQGFPPVLTEPFYGQPLNDPLNDTDWFGEGLPFQWE